MATDLQESLEQTQRIGEHGDLDEALDEAAQGHGVTSDEAVDDAGEIDAMGAAAGLVVRDDEPFRGIAEVERRDDARWELDPASTDNEPTLVTRRP